MQWLESILAGLNLSRAASGTAALLFLLCGPAGIVRAQDDVVPEEAPAAPAHTARHGFEVGSISGFAEYLSTGLPEGSLQPTGMQLPSDVGLGGSAQLEWNHFSRKSSIQVMYTPSYTGRLRFSSWNALNHDASFNASRHWGRWKIGLAGRAALSNLSEFLFAPTTFANVAATQVTFSDLAAAVLTGTYSNAELASLLTGAPINESPDRNLIFGDRMFTSALQTYVAYAPAPRVSIKLGATADRSQHLSNGQSGGTQNSYLIPKTSSAGAHLDLSYSRSPRTQLGLSANSARVVSSIADIYSTSVNASLSRTMGMHWFLQLSGGAGKMLPVRSTIKLETSLQPVGNTSLGFRTRSHTILGSYNRSVSDSYGLGATATTAASGSWHWGRPGRSWWIEGSGGWQQLGGTAFGSTSGWRFQGGYGRILGDHLTLETRYVFLHYSQDLAVVPPLSQSAVRVSVVWNHDTRELATNTHE